MLGLSDASSLKFYPWPLLFTACSYTLAEGWSC